MKAIKTDKERIHSILEVLMSYARLEFESKVSISDTGDEIDALGIGVNMLGEELIASAISIKEKENMLREIHHRVKNNLQIMSSLLNLQVQGDTDEKIRVFARESQSRIYAIALIHEMLYKAPDFKYSGFKDYVEKLTLQITNTYKIPGWNIQFDIEIPDDQVFDIDQLIPLGLILNETVSNSLKYAFPDGEGVIRIVSKSESKSNQILIGDNGKGLDPDFNLEEHGSLGMKLVYLLAEQADIKVEMKNHIGLSYHLTF